MAIRHEPHLTANLFEILPCHHQFKCLFLKPICFTLLQRVTLATLIYDIQSIEIYPFRFSHTLYNFSLYGHSVTQQTLYVIQKKVSYLWLLTQLLRRR